MCHLSPISFQAEDVFGWGSEIPDHEAISLAGSSSASGGAKPAVDTASLSRAVPRDS